MLAISIAPETFFALRGAPGGQAAYFPPPCPIPGHQGVAAPNDVACVQLTRYARLAQVALADVVFEADDRRVAMRREAVDAGNALFDLLVVPLQVLAQHFLALGHRGRVPHVDRTV